MCVSQNALGRGGVCPGGCCLPGGVVSAQGGVCPGVYPSMHWGRQPPCEQNHRQVQKHYLAATKLRTVKIENYI